MSEWEFLPDETLEDWIQRQVKRFPDPWAGVKKLNMEIYEKKLQKWVDDHRVR